MLEPARGVSNQKRAAVFRTGRIGTPLRRGFISVTTPAISRIKSGL
jgi:hypothetical protein